MAQEKNVIEQFDDYLTTLETDVNVLTGQNPVSPENTTQNNDTATSSPENTGSDDTSSIPTENANTDNTAPAENAGTDNTAPAGDATPKPEITYESDGISHAYDDLDFGRMGKPEKKQPESVKNSGGSVKPPERKRGGGKSGGGKDIMEVFWNEFIVKFYGAVIDFVVDTTLDFADWVLFKPFEGGQTTIRPKDETKNKTAYDIGDELIAEYTSNAKKGKNLFDKAHAEVLENLKKDKAGIAANWEIWKKEPLFFKELKDVAQKAEASPDSPEAEAYRRFETAPELMSGLLKKEILLRKISIGLAALDETLNPEKVSISPQISKNVKDMEKILSSKGDIEDLKTKIKEEINKMRPHVASSDMRDVAIVKKLAEMERIAESSETDSEKLTKNLSEKLIDIKKINGGEKKIEQKSQGYYETLMENIDKIHKFYKTDPEKAKTATKAYMSYVTNTLNCAKRDVDRCMEANLVTRTKRKTTAQKSLASAQQALNDFILGEKPIREQETSEERSSCPLTGDTYTILNVVKNFGSSR